MGLLGAVRLAPGVTVERMGEEFLALAGQQVVRVSGPSAVVLAAVHAERDVRPGFGSDVEVGADEVGLAVDVLVDLGVLERTSEADVAVESGALPVSRRRAIRVAATAAALGVTVLVLPQAAAAQSVGGANVTPAAFTFDEELDRPVAGWLPFDAGEAETTHADATISGLSAALSLGGTKTSLGSGFALDDPEVRGLTSATVTDYRMRNSSSTIDPDGSPHLEFSITVDEGTLSLSTLVLHSVRHMGTGGESALANLAAFVSTDGTSWTLRRTASIPVEGSHRHVVVNLGLSSPLGKNTTARVRVFPFSMPNARDVRFGPRNSSPAPTPLTSADTINDSVTNVAIGETGPNWIAAFIGRYTPPEST